ncbi:MAG: PAS domain S-box protein [Candidatus Kuenenia sp.]|nr:PAS domain S-box protein [Candidatus Kuenenia hertensis]
MKILLQPLRFIISVAIFFLLTGICVYQLHNHKAEINSFIEKEIVSRAMYGGMQASHTLENFIRNKDLHGVERTISWFGEDPDINLALLVDNNNTVIFSTRYELKGRPFSGMQSSMASNLIEKAINLSSKQYQFSGDRLACIFVFPVSFGAKPGELRPSKEGFLYLEYGLAHAKKAGHIGVIRGFYQFTAVLGLFCLLLWGFFEWVLTRRIKRLVAATQSLMVENHDVRANIEGRDELAYLGKSFDLMARRIRENTLDITERKKLEDQILKLSQAIEQSTVSVIITDLCGNIQYVNPMFTKITGYTKEEVIGQNPRILKSGRTSYDEYRNLWDTVTSGNSWQGEFYNKKKNGECYWELAQIMPMRNTEGKIINFLAIKEDITERKQAEEKQAALREQLYHSQRIDSLGQLAGGIAHDFNNILTAIIGYARLMSIEASKNVALEDYSRKIVESAKKAAQLTRGLLAYSRKQVMNPKLVNLNTIIKKAELLTERIIREDIEYKLLLTEKDLTVMADSGQIEQVLINLVTNARDAMPEGGTLTIRTDVEVFRNKYIKQLHGVANAGHYALLSVSDMGTGIDEETGKKMFEPFYTTKEVNKGTGLGLSIVDGIVKQHNGYIDVRSKPGEGSEFIVYLPLVDVAMEETEMKTKKIPVKGTETILLAEDDESVRVLIEKSLEMYGYRVITAVDGEDATNKFMRNSEDIDLLIFDVRMPKRNGKKTYEVIEKMRREMKIIFLSGYSEDAFDQSINPGKCVTFIQKPVSPDNLLKKVREILDS